MAGHSTLQCIFRPIDKEDMQECWIFPHVTCNFGHHRNFILFILGKKSQEFLEN